VMISGVSFVGMVLSRFYLCTLGTAKLSLNKTRATETLRWKVRSVRQHALTVIPLLFGRLSFGSRSASRFRDEAGTTDEPGNIGSTKDNRYFRLPGVIRLF